MAMTGVHFVMLWYITSVPCVQLLHAISKAIYLLWLVWPCHCL